MVTMDHTEAIRTGAAQKYLLDELSPEERSQYEEHFFDCTLCADDVKSAAAFVDNLKAVLAEPVVVRAEALAEDRPRPAPWRLFWPVPAGALAALVSMLGVPAAYLAFVEVPRLRSALADAESPQAATWQFLSVSRGEPPVVKVTKTTRMVGLTLSKSSERVFPFYLCEVRELGDRVVSRAVVPGPGPGAELQILIPVSVMPPGAYVLHLAGLESATSTAGADLARYPFTLQLREE